MQKLSAVTDVDLGTYVKEAMNKVFGEQSLNSDLFTAVKDLAGTKIVKNGDAIDDHSGASHNLADHDKNFAESNDHRGIQFINDTIFLLMLKKHLQKLLVKH